MERDNISITQSSTQSSFARLRALIVLQFVQLLPSSFLEAPNEHHLECLLKYRILNHFDPNLRFSSLLFSPL